MGKLGTFDFPHTQINTLIEATKVLVNTFKGNVNSEKTFAEALGHKSPKSGGFLLKLSDLRKYGFIEKRGLTATTRAKKIINPLNPNERRHELSKAVSEIPLWMALYEKIRTKQPTSEDFKLQLKDITDDRDAVVKIGDKILNLYKDAMNYYIEGEVKRDSNLSKDTSGMIPTTDKDGIFEANFGDIYIRIPKSQRGKRSFERMIPLIKEELDEAIGNVEGNITEKIQKHKKEGK